MVSPLEFSRERDKRIFNIVDRASVTIKQLVKLGVFPSYAVASRRLVRMRVRKRGRRIRCVGQVPLHDAGREAKVFCSYVPNALLHEVLLSEELIGWPIDFTIWKRGPFVDSELRADAEFGKLFIEFETGNKSQKQMKKRLEQYHGVDARVVWILPTMNRFTWAKEFGDPRNTLVKLPGASEVYDVDGRCVTVDKLCRTTLSLFGNHST